MLEEFLDLPTHPLLVHAAVVLVPLLALLTAAYVLVPLVRRHFRWVLGLLALVTPGAAFLTKLSGDAFFNRLDSEGRITAEFYPKIESHQEFGTLTLYATIALAVLTLALVYFVGPQGFRPRGAAARFASGPVAERVLPLVLGGLSLVAAAVSLYYVLRTGDSGARTVWGDS